MERIKTDICVIGAGSGGLSVAAGAVQMGAKVVLIEGHKMGGDCLNYGCVPSKALLAAGKQAQAMRTNESFGVTPVMPEVSYSAAKDHVHRVIKTIAPVDSEERFEGLGVHVIREWGRFISRTEVQAGDTVIEARRFVIATGSSPFVPPIPGVEDVEAHTNETIFDLRERPEHLLIIGGGPIGMEMAQAHVRLGSKVTVIEGQTAMGKDDPELAAIVLEKLRAEGVEIVEGAQATRIKGEDGRITVETEGGSFTGTHLLMAVGRKVNIETLDLEKAGVAHDRAVKVGADLRSVTNKRVYAVGDAAGGLQFTHLAGYHAGVIVRSMLFALPSKQRTDHIPWVTYTDPELAQVGLTEEQAIREHGRHAVTVARFPYEENDRAIAEGKTTGLIKVMVVKGRPVGASIVGAQAGELIGVWALAIANKLKMSAVANMVAPYPTLGEINKRAAGAYFSPKLFDNPTVKKVVGFVQTYLP
ncbi:dihydrolipoyl dehydrogenase family protein [Ovoidimarina sediminis]|uniref:dihydrolipoyl dehydrogenase family protein n=1 Tax=Ovoidimarina sediminis TaxID=3079856 RepID=UPI002911E466|nr:FAD-dependent oxidoreductase [Rhodophyticola sp. MJ-SS7]MDU8946327.1 FAD-dependent oxidoreductase [Rhodophyticola sp. MJ-SS7]